MNKSFKDNICSIVVFPVAFYIISYEQYFPPIFMGIKIVENGYKLSKVYTVNTRVRNKI